MSTPRGIPNAASNHTAKLARIRFDTAVRPRLRPDPGADGFLPPRQAARVMRVSVPELAAWCRTGRAGDRRRRRTVSAIGTSSAERIGKFPYLGTDHGKQHPHEEPGDSEGACRDSDQRHAPQAPVWSLGQSGPARHERDDPECETGSRPRTERTARTPQTPTTSDAYADSRTSIPGPDVLLRSLGP